MKVERAEIRSLDHMANKYYAFASMIYCGIDGIIHKLKLPEPTVEDPGKLDPKLRLELNIHDIPKTFADRKAWMLGKEGFEDVGKPIRDLFGDHALNNYLAVHKRDHDLFSNVTLEEEINILTEKF